MYFCFSFIINLNLYHYNVRPTAGPLFPFMKSILEKRESKTQASGKFYPLLVNGVLMGWKYSYEEALIDKTRRNFGRLSTKPHLY